MSDSPSQAPSPQARGGAGWAALLRELLRSFLLIRDLVGYVLPGGLAVFVLVHAYGPRLIRPLRSDMTPWLLVPVLLGIAYLAGQICVALGFGLQQRFAGLLDLVSASMRERVPALWPEDDGAGKRRAIALSFHRGREGERFADAEHRATVAMLRTGIGGALALGALAYAWRAYTFATLQLPVNEWSAAKRALVLLAGALYMLASARQGWQSAANERQAALVAAELAQAGRLPEPVDPGSAGPSQA
jgi:hypothetical protein